jgi:hypothetical protein
MGWMVGGGECVCNILGLSNAETKVFDVYFRELNVIIPSSFHIFYPSLLLFIFFIPVVVGWGGGFFDVMGPAPSIPAVGAARSPDEISPRPPTYCGAQNLRPETYSSAHPQ